ncbi:class I SAM-dependent methyltransferase [Azospirillum sp. A39]|uniref:class I SAM-dependent methyltransferase n=1 Tax=Azospirillum sp. A39 TaxID=3462279 RepID=UPI00404555C7
MFDFLNRRPDADAAKVTATRATLSDDWQALSRKTTWVAAPGVTDYVNRNVSGRGLDEGGHWAVHARDRHLAPLLEKRRAEGASGLSMLSIGCGAGAMDARLVGEFGWPVERYVGLEYDDALRAAAAAAVGAAGSCRTEVRFFDFDAGTEAGETFDLVFTFHAIHHARDLEGLLRFVNASMKDDGLFLGVDYFGPTRFQIEHDVLPLLRELFDALPAELRRDLSRPDMPVCERFEPDTIAAVAGADPSEAVRSSDLRTLLFATFPVVEIAERGGTLLRWLLQNRAGNFRADDPNHRAILTLLQFIERELIAARRIRSDDLFFVLGKSGRI